MLTKLAVVIILQYIYQIIMLDIHLKLVQCYVDYVSLKLEKINLKMIHSGFNFKFENS